MIALYVALVALVVAAVVAAVWLKREGERRWRRQQQIDALARMGPAIRRLAVEMQRMESALKQVGKALLALGVRP